MYDFYIRRYVGWTESIETSRDEEEIAVLSVELAYRQGGILVGTEQTTGVNL